MVGELTGPVLLVHSPLVGPSSWSRFAREMSQRGASPIVPDLTGVATAAPPRWQHMVDGAVAAVGPDPDPILVAGHSGAGVLLPEVAARLGDRLRALVFVDAVVPPRSGVHVTSAAMRDHLDGLEEDGWLPRWLDWWPPDIVASLIPDPADRRTLRRDMPRLPRAFYDEPVAVPDGWSERPCAYLRLSAAYEAEFDEAGARGWPRLTLDGTHLAMHTEPQRVADAMRTLLGELRV